MFNSIPPALRHRDFRLLWLGLFVSTSGSMMQTAAISWHIYDITNLPFALSFIGLTRVIPIFIFSPISGLAADRFDRRKVILVTQTCMLITATILGIVAYSGSKSALPVYFLAAIAAGFGVFDAPARQAMVPSLVSREDLPNAFSVNSIMFQTASVIGPAMAGIVIGRVGLHWAYWFNAVSFLTVIVALLAMKPRLQTREEKEKRPEISVAAAVEGFKFVRREPLILSSMLLDFFATFFSSATVLLPIYAKDILKVGAEGYGWLYAADAAGAAAAAITMAFMPRIQRQGQTLIIAVFIYGVATIWFGLSTNFISAFLALALTGVADAISVVIRNTIRQLATPDHLRGRMVSVNMIFFQGGPQLGNIEAGLVAQWFGAPFSVISGGVGCVIAVVWVARKWKTLWNYGNEMEAKVVAAD